MRREAVPKKVKEATVKLKKQKVREPQISPWSILRRAYSKFRVTVETTDLYR